MASGVPCILVRETKPGKALEVTLAGVPQSFCSFIEDSSRASVVAFFRELARELEQERSLLDFHIKVTDSPRTRPSGFKLEVFFGDQYRTGPVVVAPGECISCFAHAVLHPGKLPLITAGECVMDEVDGDGHVQCSIDAKARPGFIVTPLRHVERMSDLENDELYALWSAAVKALRSEDAMLHLPVRLAWPLHRQELWKRLERLASLSARNSDFHLRFRLRLLLLVVLITAIVVARHWLAMATSFYASDTAAFLHRTSTDTAIRLTSLPPRRGPFLPVPSLLKARPRHSQLRCRSLQVIAFASASSNNNNSSLDDLAARLVDAARSISQRTGHMIESAWIQTVQFVEDQNFQGKFQQGFNVANRKLEELTYDARKGAENFDRHFRVSERAQEMSHFASQQVKKFDQQLGLVQKFRNFSSDMQRNWPRYRRQLNQFLQTPIGRMFTTIAFMWFLLSGWLFRIILFSMWVLPLAAPLLISSAARNMIVEGSCPSCKRRFIGSRNQMVICNYCKAVVWQPRQDYSKGQADPTIIDVDID
ncbi:hypothetical protein L7F22_067725 [Adiantum nelumboides]|nr:hypothetical protein [Adiantum nelumboides]